MAESEAIDYNTKAPSDPNPAAEKAGSLLHGAPQCDTSAAPFKGTATAQSKERMAESEAIDLNTKAKVIHSPRPLTLQQKTKKTQRALQIRIPARTYYHKK